MYAMYLTKLKLFDTEKVRFTQRFAVQCSVVRMRRCIHHENLFQAVFDLFMINMLDAYVTNLCDV